MAAPRRQRCRCGGWVLALCAHAAALALLLPSRPPLGAGFTGIAGRPRSGGHGTAAAAGGDRQGLVDTEGMAYARFQGGAVVETQGPEAEEAPGPRGEAKQAKEAKEPEEWFVGKVKSYAPQQGYGFIECPDTFARHNSDVFLHKKQVEVQGGTTLSKGDSVRFSIEMNKAGRPQARNVERYAEASWIQPTKTFVGRIKDYTPEKGFGFIACGETRNIFNSDVFLHKKQHEEAGGLDKGTLVTFTLEVSAKGRPQARNVMRFVPETFEGEGQAVSS